MRLKSSELALSDAEIDAAASLTEKSSVRWLVESSPHLLSQVLRGPMSLGTLVHETGYSSVPSQVNPDPAGQGYFNGGYNTAVHGSRDGGVIDGIQIETMEV